MPIAWHGVGLNVSGVEAFWIFTTGVGLVLMISFFFETREDRRKLRASKRNGAAKIVAESGYRRQGLKVALVSVLFLPAVIAGLYPVPIPEGPRAIMFLFLSSAPIILLLLNMIDRMEKHSLMDYFEHMSPDELRQETEDRIQEKDNDESHSI